MKKHTLWIMISMAPLGVHAQYSVPFLSETVPTVTALGVDPYDTELFMGVDDASTGFCLRSDGVTVSDCGTGFDDYIYDVCPFGAFTYAVGDMTTSGGYPTIGIAQWSGFGWLPINDWGLEYRADACSVRHDSLGNEVAMGVTGSFFYAGGDEQHYFSALSPMTWSDGVSELMGICGPGYDVLAIDSGYLISYKKDHYACTVEGVTSGLVYFGDETYAYFDVTIFDGGQPRVLALWHNEPVVAVEYEVDPGVFETRLAQVRGPAERVWVSDRFNGRVHDMSQDPACGTLVLAGKFTDAGIAALDYSGGELEYLSGVLGYGNATAFFQGKFLVGGHFTGSNVREVILECDSMTSGHVTNVLHDRMELYPNPIVGDVLFVRLPGSNAQPYSFCIRDASGMLVHDGEVVGDDEWGISLAWLPSGLYTIGCQLRDGYTHHGSFVIVRQ